MGQSPAGVRASQIVAVNQDPSARARHVEAWYKPVRSVRADGSLERSQARYLQP
jgi:hypothetical protein